MLLAKPSSQSDPILQGEKLRQEIYLGLQTVAERGGGVVVVEFYLMYSFFLKYLLSICSSSVDPPPSV